MYEFELPLERESFPHARMRSLLVKYLGDQCCGFRIQPKRSCGQREGDVWWDSPYGLMLTYFEFPHSLVGFEREGTALCAIQLQGVQALQTRYVGQHFRWERLLLEALRVLAEETQWCTAARVLKAELTPWYDDPSLVLNRSVEEYQAGLKRRYNGTARALKFKPLGNEWVYPLDRAA